MIRSMILSLLLSGVVAVPALANGREVLNLSGPSWQMEGIRPGEGVRHGFHLHFGETASSFFNWNGAEVPGDVYTDLWRAGEIPDPHYGRNALQAKWVMEKEWWYRRQFAVPPHWKGRRVFLHFEGVDYACEVWLNGQYLGRHEGMFSPFEFDVTDVLRYEDDIRANGLAVRLEPPPRAYRLVAGRKFGWHGDYWRAITPFGIWRPVKLIATGPVRITDVYPRSTLNPDGSATVRVDVELTPAVLEQETQLTVHGTIRGHGFQAGPFEARQRVTCEDEPVTVTLEFHIANPMLWWPWDLGTPHRHILEVALEGPSGDVLDNQSLLFGIREVRMARNPGYTEQEVRHPWTVLINGKKVFLRSANWGGPPDIFYGRNSLEKYRTLVRLARDANINNLRIFGWHPTEIDLFYDLCDEFGITVWQDLIPLASVSLPQDEEFRRATYAEAIAVIKRLRRHPCLVLLEGGEEMFYGREGLQYNADFLRGLGEAIRPYTDLYYVPTSPLNWPPIVHRLGLGGPKDSAHTHALFYGLGSRLLEDYVREWDYAVIPEFAVSSCPNVESIRRFIPPNELWPPGPSWGFHWADLDVFRALNYQILGSEHTGSLEEFVKATQITQGTIFQWGIEHVRRRKPKSSAISICHFITWAPDMKWGIVDYFQVPKRSYYFVQRAYQPLLICLETHKRRWKPTETFTANLWIVNDYHRDYRDTTVRVAITRPDGQALAAHDYAVDKIASNSSATVAELRWPVKMTEGERFDVHLTLSSQQGEVLSKNYYIFLVGDQEKVRQECRERTARWHELRSKFHPADYYRFYPGLSGKERFQRFGDEPVRAEGFE